MTLVTLSLKENRRLELRCDHPRISEDRDIAPADCDVFTGWSVAYRAALVKPNAADLLLELGRQIGRWLDGTQRILWDSQTGDRRFLATNYNAIASQSPSTATRLCTKARGWAEKRGPTPGHRFKKSTYRNAVA